MRVVYKQWFDKKGAAKGEHWIIQQWRRGLFGWKWKPLTHQVCFESGCYQRITEFSSADEAQTTIDRIERGAPINKWVSTAL